MVSFQCHACGDVVKKPKLDQHRGRCHAGFDCIDCSTTFNTPAEYRGHTQCISEAEKYQKGLYKGPKQGGGRENGNVKFHDSNAPTGKYKTWSRGYASGSGPGWGMPRSQGTGANDTPLGTPRRMSPITLSQASDDVSQALVNDKNEPADALNSIALTEAQSKEKKRDKKRKTSAHTEGESHVATDVEGESRKKRVKSSQVKQAGDSASVDPPFDNPLEAPSTEKPDKSHKKKKKHSVVADNLQSADTIATAVLTSSEEPSQGAAEKRKKKKGKTKHTSEKPLNGSGKPEGERKEEEVKDAEVHNSKGDAAETGSENTVKKEKKEKKRTKKHANEVASVTEDVKGKANNKPENGQVDGESEKIQVGEGEKANKKSKKRKATIGDAGHPLEVAEEGVETGKAEAEQDPPSRDKSHKRKRDETNAEAGDKKKKKTKSKSAKEDSVVQGADSTSSMPTLADEGKKEKKEKKKDKKDKDRLKTKSSIVPIPVEVAVSA